MVWSPAVLNSPGKKPTRGFGGRVYFYDGQNRAVPVEGQLVVYGYNDSRPQEGKSPDRTFAFTPEQFAAHFSPSDLGASYSVWVPWDEVGSEQVEVSLVPIFTATSGQIVVGQSSKSLLPGPATVNTPTRIEQFTLPPPQITYEQAPGAFDVQRASYQEAPADSPLAEQCDHRAGCRKPRSACPAPWPSEWPTPARKELLGERNPAPPAPWQSSQPSAAAAPYGEAGDSAVVADESTTSSFRTLRTSGSIRARASANSRSDSEATVPRSTAVRPSIVTSGKPTNWIPGSLGRRRCERVDAGGRNGQRREAELEADANRRLRAAPLIVVLVDALHPLGKQIL